MPALISIEEARRRVLAEVVPLESCELGLDGALGRVLAEEVRSEVEVPPFDSSAMDGYAVAPGAEGELRVAGEARAGHPSPVAVTPGSAIRISTGACVPDGTAAVVPVERVTETGPTVRVPSLPQGANVRRSGEDIRPGDVVLHAGAELGPAGLGVLASVGRASVRCAASPRVAVLATGDELAPPGTTLGPGRIWSSNQPALAAQVELAGAELALTSTVQDDASATRSAIDAALGQADVVCISGGVSVGPHDHVKGALAALDVDERFWGVALRPGKPTWFGAIERDGRRRLVFGLPGNPVSAMVTFQLFVRPALRALQGAEPAASRSSALLDAALPQNPRREEAVRCTLRHGPDGLHAAPTGAQGSHVLTSMLAADALALVPAGEGELPAGGRVEVELLRRL